MRTLLPSLCAKYLHNPVKHITRDLGAGQCLRIGVATPRIIAPIDNWEVLFGEGTRTAAAFTACRLCRFARPSVHLLCMEGGRERDRSTPNALPYSMIASSSDRV